jgi:hypothetical protein
MAIQVQTKENDIKSKLGSIVEAGRIIASDDVRVIELLEQIEQLKKADKDAAAVLEAFLLHMTGDLDQALSALDQTSTGMPQERLKLLANYSLCSKAQILFAKYGEPSKGEFSSLYFCGIASGAIHQLAAFGREAQKMKLTNLEKLPIDEINMSDCLLTELKIDDKLVGRLMETAGEVLREHGLLFYGRSPSLEYFDVPEEIRAVHCTYRIPVSSDSAVDLYLKFLDRLEEKNMELPQGFHIAFSGANA